MFARMSGKKRWMLAPTRRNLALAVAMMLGSLSVFLLRLVPVQIDVLRVRRLPAIAAAILFRWPIDLFDFLTRRRFAPRGEGFLVFPTLPQILFAVALDFALLYALACAILAVRSTGTESE